MRAEQEQGRSRSMVGLGAMQEKCRSRVGAGQEQKRGVNRSRIGAGSALEQKPNITHHTKLYPNWV